MARFQSQLSAKLSSAWEPKNFYFRFWRAATRTTSNFAKQSSVASSFHLFDRPWSTSLSKNCWDTLEMLALKQENFACWSSTLWGRKSKQRAESRFLTSRPRTFCLSIIVSLMILPKRSEALQLKASLVSAASHSWSLSKAWQKGSHLLR